MRSQNFRTLKFRPRTHGINGGLRELIGQSFEFAVIARVFDFHGVEGVECRIDAPKPQGAGRRSRGVEFAPDSPLEGAGFEP
jgi:hypothetical protein